VGAIDLHTHILPRGWDDFLARHADSRWPRIVQEEGGGCALLRGTVRDRGLTEHVFDAARRVEDLDRLGIERQVLSPPPLMFCYWAPAEAAAEFCRLHNDAIAAVVAARPARFLGAAIVPLHAPDLAVKELERAARCGFRVIEIGSSVDGRDLDEEPFQGRRPPPSTLPCSCIPPRRCSVRRASSGTTCLWSSGIPWRRRSA
jgi:aminocarboxymuconate-semialdehyde decarboxylase